MLFSYGSCINGYAGFKHPRSLRHLKPAPLGSFLPPRVSSTFLPDGLFAPPFSAPFSPLFQVAPPSFSSSLFAVIACRRPVLCFFPRTHMNLLLVPDLINLIPTLSLLRANQCMCNAIVPPPTSQFRIYNFPLTQTPPPSFLQRSPGCLPGRWPPPAVGVLFVLDSLFNFFKELDAAAHPSPSLFPGSLTRSLDP